MDTQISIVTICGLDELNSHSSRGVTHVLSLLDPEWPEPESFWSYDPHHRTTLHFHDVIGPGRNMVVPKPEHVDAILSFGRSLAKRRDAHLLVHCHAGVSRSTAATAMLMAQAEPGEDEVRIFNRLLELRPQAWPNSLMIAFADEQLQRGGRLSAAMRKLHARQLLRYPELEPDLRNNWRDSEVELARALLTESG